MPETAWMNKRCTCASVFAPARTLVGDAHFDDTCRSQWRLQARDEAPLARRSSRHRDIGITLNRRHLQYRRRRKPGRMLRSRRIRHVVLIRGELGGLENLLQLDDSRHGGRRPGRTSCSDVEVSVVPDCFRDDVRHADVSNFATTIVEGLCAGHCRRVRLIRHLPVMAGRTSEGRPGLASSAHAEMGA